MSIEIKATGAGRMVEQDVRRFLEVLACGQPFEIRRKLGNGVAGRVYGANQQAAAVDDLRMLDGQQATACWVTLNGTTMQPGPWSSTTTKDADVHARRWLLVDVDPQRPKDTNATDAELAAARTTADAVQQHLRGAGWPQPVRLMSGNGWHLLWRVDLPADDGGTLRRVLQALAARFNTPEQVNTEQVKVDVANHNPARITKVAGTVARKGPHTPERPQRVARLLEVPDPVVPVPRELLEQVAADAPTSATAAVQVQQPVQRGARVPFPKDVTGPGRADAVAAWLEAHGVSIKRTQRKGSATWLYLNACPCCTPPLLSENGSDLGVCVADAGRISYHNQHNRGAGLTWAHLRAAIDPTYGRARSQPAAPGAPEREPDDEDVRGDLEVVVLRGLAQFSTRHAEQAVVLAGIRAGLEGYPWTQRALLEGVTSALGQHDGAASSVDLLRAHGVDKGVAEFLLERVRPEQVQAAIDWLKAWLTRHRDEQVHLKLSDALRDDRPVADRLDTARTMLEQHLATADGGVLMGRDHVRVLVDGIVAKHGAQLRGLGTGVTWMDQATDGIRGLMLLAAAPGVGKSNFALWLQQAVLRTEPEACCIFLSGEMDAATVYARLLAQRANLPEGFVVKGTEAALGAGTHLEAARARLEQARTQLEEQAHRMVVHQVLGRRGLTVGKLEQVVRHVQRVGGCRKAFVVVDSLQAVGACMSLEGTPRSEVDQDNMLISAVSELQARLDQPIMLISEQNKQHMSTAELTGVRGSARAIYTPSIVQFLCDPIVDVEEHDAKGRPVKRKVRKPDSTPEVRRLWLETRKARGGGQHGCVKLQHFYRTGNWLPQKGSD
jgi:KaiC/GvpD/RAD55 family RecA-like ATPase